jgi:hypothetical protein
MAVGFAYRVKTSAVKNVVIPDKGITLRNILEMLGAFSKSF